MRTQAACFLRRDCSAEVVGDMFILNFMDEKYVCVCSFTYPAEKLLVEEVLYCTVTVCDLTFPKV